MKKLLARFVHEDKAQDLVEAALVAGLIAVIAMVAIATIGTQISARFWGISPGLAS